MSDMKGMVTIPTSSIWFKAVRLTVILDKHFGGEKLSTDEKIYYNLHSDKVCTFVKNWNDIINGARLRKFTFEDETE